MEKKKVLAVLKELAIWAPTLMLAFVFVMQGSAKFSATSGWVSAFKHWGYPDWFRMAVGAWELLAGLIIVWRRTSPIGAIMIILVMLGAMATHTFVDGKPRDVFHEIVPLTLATIVLLARREQLRQLLRGASSGPAR